MLEIRTKNCIISHISGKDRQFWFFKLESTRTALVCTMRLCCTVNNRCVGGLDCLFLHVISGLGNVNSVNNTVIRRDCTIPV